jgi:hypothetical protein
MGINILTTTTTAAITIIAIAPTPMTRTEMTAATTTSQQQQWEYCNSSTKWPHLWQQPQQPTTMTPTTSNILQ